MAPLQQPFAVVEGAQIDSGQFARKLICGQILQIFAELAHTVFAIAAAILQAGDRQFRLVQLNTIDPGIDLDADDRLEILAPDRVIAIHQVRLVLAIRALDPERMESRTVDVTRTALLREIGYFLSQ